MNTTDNKATLNWFAKHKILTGIGAILCIMIGVSIASSSDTSKSSTNQNTNSTTNADTASQATPKSWKSVISFAAEQNKQSETFNLQGGQQKLSYETTGDEFTACYVYLMEENETLDKDGGIPAVIISGAKKDETLLRKPCGNYYLDVKIANGKCSLELEEMK